MEKTDDDLAIRYNDQSILENHHISHSMELLKGENCNILQDFDKRQKREYRKILIHCILETDLAKHQSTLNDLNEDLSNARDNQDEPCLDASSPKNHVRCLALMLHCCDISNPTKEWHIYREWTNKIVAEFNDQYAEEERRNIAHGFYNPETPLPEFQLGFINFMVIPFYVAVDSIEGINLGVPLFQLNKNLQKWKLQLVARSIRSLSSTEEASLQEKPAV